MKQPNIIFFFVDQQRWDTCGCYGQNLNITPNLDKMAKEGVKFKNAFTCQPVCGPARACIQTGMWATQNECYRNAIALREKEKTIAHHLSENGYDVGYIGKWHLAGNRSVPGIPDSDFSTKPVPPELRGGYKDFWLASDVLEFTSHGYDGYMFDQNGDKRYFPEDRFRADAQTDGVLEYLNSRNTEKPFFLFNSYIEPHHQNDHYCYEGPHGAKEKYKNFSVPGDLVNTEGDWKKEFPDYLGCCASLDWNLGRIRAELTKLGIEDETLIIYTSDHGSHFKTRNKEYKRSCHDASIRIPMIIHGPGFKGGKVVKELVSLIDTPATVLSAGGVGVPDAFAGKPLQELVEGSAKEWPEEIFLQISESQVGRAIRTEKWKYSICAEDKSGWYDSCSEIYTEDFLYDLENDPHEQNNLVLLPEFCEIRNKLSGILKRKMIEAGEKQPVIKQNSK
jgi:arylsulfatase A-like enzyme